MINYSWNRQKTWWFHEVWKFIHLNLRNIRGEIWSRTVGKSQTLEGQSFVNFGHYGIPDGLKLNCRLSSFTFVYIKSFSLAEGKTVSHLPLSKRKKCTLTWLKVMGGTWPLYHQPLLPVPAALWGWFYLRISFHE